MSCNLSQGIKERAYVEGVEKGILLSIKNLAANADISIEQAMVMLGVSDVDKNRYMEMLKEQWIIKEKNSAPASYYR